jgi:glycosyltransferase involved in cell wall biosynthesis
MPVTTTCFSRLSHKELPVKKSPDPKVRNHGNTTIDILFPYYGDVEMMKKAVNSVLGQTYHNWRLLAFDDGYPSKEPGKFFESIIKDDTRLWGSQRIFYERNAQNLGANGNYKKALSKATSEYYVMMGADDLMHENFLKKFIDVISEVGDVDMYQPSVDVIDENDKKYVPLADKIKRKLQPKESGIFSGEYIAKSLMHGSWHYFPSMVWKTASAKKVGFNKDYDVVQDVCMILDIIQGGGNLYFDKDAYSFSYRRHSQSDSSVKALDGYRFNEELNFFRFKAAQFKELGWKGAEFAAKLHVTSRLNALVSIPKAIKEPKGKPFTLLRNIVSW